MITPNHTYNQWNFQYISNQIKCAQGSAQTQINIIWECVGGTVLSPSIFEINYDINNLQEHLMIVHFMIMIIIN